jgi:hypothetical protein
MAVFISHYRLVILFLHKRGWREIKGEQKLTHFDPGSISLSWSIFAFLYLPDTPMNAWFLDDQEKFYVIYRLAENKTGIVNKTWKREQATEAIVDPKTWIIFLFNIAINIPNGGESIYCFPCVYLPFNSNESS